MRLLKFTALLSILAVAAGVAAQADPGRNLEAVLRPASDNGFGLVEFRQPKDGTTVIYLDVWVRDLLPNHEYTVQRATDTTVDDVCSGTNWTMPPLGSITTDASGTGRAALTRPLPAVLIGRELDIHFRVVDPASPDVAVLQSACYQFTVSDE